MIYKFLIKFNEINSSDMRATHLIKSKNTVINEFHFSSMS